MKHMNNRKHFFALTAIALLTVTACNNSNPSNNNKVNSNSIDELANLPVETDESLTSELTLVNADGIYGNVYLPENINGAKITWFSSDANVINPKQDYDAAPGVVNRPASDKEITLTAKIEKDGTTSKFEQKVLVKAAPMEIADEDYVGYLFCHFTGQEGDTKHEQIYFALADEGEGLHFTDMNGATTSNLRPVLTSNVGDKGVRDPFIYRSPEGDTYRIIATDLSVKNRGGWKNDHDYTRKGSHYITMWESHDLVNWSEAKLLEVAREDAGMAWAPEMIYHEETGQYVIIFSSTICNEDKSQILERDCIYYTTTRDFVHFGETKKFIKNQPYPEGQTDPQTNAPHAINNDERKIIDASVIKIDDWYYCAAKDGDNHENNGGILIQRTQDIFDIDSWEKVCEIADIPGLSASVELTNKQLEGPEWFHYNVADRTDEDVDEIGLMADMYMRNSGYLPLSTIDIMDIENANGSWKVLGSSDYSWSGLIKRHGSIMRLTHDEIEAIKEAYPNTK